MPIKVSCDDCFTDLKVADQHAGKKIKCRECGKVLTIPVPQRGVRPAESRQNKLEDAWDESQLEDAEDEADELPAAPRGTKSSRKKKRSSNNWYDWQNLQHNPFAGWPGMMGKDTHLGWPRLLCNHPFQGFFSSGLRRR